jgi:hypothetical protein
VRRQIDRRQQAGDQKRDSTEGEEGSFAENQCESDAEMVHVAILDVRLWISDRSIDRQSKTEDRFSFLMAFPVYRLAFGAG